MKSQISAKTLVNDYIADFRGTDEHDEHVIRHFAEWVDRWNQTRKDHSQQVRAALSGTPELADCVHPLGALFHHGYVSGKMHDYRCNLCDVVVNIPGLDSRIWVSRKNRFSSRRCEMSGLTNECYSADCHKLPIEGSVLCQECYDALPAPLKGETVKVGLDNNVSHIILAAVANFVHDPDFMDKFRSIGGTQKVELYINGHAVPVVESIADMWGRCEKELEKRARKMAVQMVTVAGLDPLADALRDAEHAIREKLGIWEDY